MDEQNRLRYVLLIAISFFSGCASTQIPSRLNNLSDHEQVMFVVPHSKNSTTGTLTAFEKNRNSWQKIYKLPVVLGRAGLADQDAKLEGDGYTPSGTYSIKRAFGYADQISTGLHYEQATANDYWVDDVRSPQYNQWVHGKPQADSYETMRRIDDLYQMGAVIEYNTDPIVPGKGSAIFLHIWRSYHSPTAGCVAASRRNIRKLLGWLRIDKKPIIVLMPN